MNGIFCLEGEWDPDLRRRDSVEPALELLDRLEIAKYIHRDVATRAELEYYLRGTTYLAEWAGNRRRYASFRLLYLAFHGESGVVRLGRDTIDLKDLATLLSDRCNGRMIHFASCLSLAAQDAELKKFAKTTGATAITGYEKEVDWLDSAAFEVLLLDRPLRSKQAAAPFRQLHETHGTCATELGLVAATGTSVYRG